jgi:hypothetical protein
LEHDHGVAETVLESGSIEPIDDLVHAVRRRLTGGTALCGAGLIMRIVAGRFDPESQEACPACAAAARDE